MYSLPGFRTMVGVLLCLVIPGRVDLAAREGLYAPHRPGDAALVRVVNLSPRKDSPPLRLGPVRFPPKPAMTAGPYRPVPRGVYRLPGPERTVVSPEPASFVTIVTGFAPEPGEKHHVFQDTPHDDPARAQLVFYNLSEKELGLVVADSGKAIFPPFSGPASATVALNAVAVELEIRHNGVAMVVTEVLLSRGDSTAVFAVPRHPGLVGFTARASVVQD
ncbi:hypothetical protein AU468_05315 [Alkalispirochaeta sphaeroplastigenens]|uniref:Alginate biosynthesis protein AlgF n=1 Tax=Alkalispirochaeta sphaeroplastigenens TaxID=1187066 RepID=A0A2S4JUS6_9SPIO|nr:alginate O-acetyltransferase AlgF [Alkalispirochaeta sphaeroplastigenens]POR03277.1 hypothetical protein AU468_05315 [Alkalispirochaeta sphaeroplastigenens]